MTTTFATAARRAAPLALALGGALAVVAGPGPAAAATLIQSCPYTILAPGTYVLDRDLTCPAPAAITVAADDVRLDLGGNTLASDGEAVFGVFANGTEANPTIERLRVANGTVRGFFAGVLVEDAPAVRVAGVTATGNSNGIFAFDTPRARFTGNTLTGNEDDGMDLNGDCDGCVVTGNRAAGNGDNGIQLFDGITNARVEGNRATGNGGDGIELTEASVDGNLVRGNTTTGNAGNGIGVAAGATGNRLEGNRATGNGEVDLEDLNLDDDPPACVNAWRGNRFATDNEGDGPGAGCIR